MVGHSARFFAAVARGAGGACVPGHGRPRGRELARHAGVGPDGDVPGHWSLGDPRFANLWGPGLPREMMETATSLADA